MLSALLLASAAAVSAFNATGPYGVHITGKENSSIDGYGGACHAGAAIEGLCFVDGALNATEDYQQFYFNSSSYDFDTGAPSSYGWLEWELPFSGDGTIDKEPSALQLFLSLGSNVNGALFYPGIDQYTTFTKGDDGSLFIANAIDDSNFNATFPNPVPSFSNLTNWHLCYQFTGGYYYQSIAWVSSQPPQNPSCEPVDLTLELISTATEGYEVV